MMNSVERISLIIPKFKQQLIFLEEREKLFQKINDCSIPIDDMALSDESKRCQSLVTASANVLASSRVSINSQLPSTLSVNSQSSPTVSLNSQPSFVVRAETTTTADQSNPSAGGNIPFPEDYKIPALPKELIEEIENKTMDKFGPHCSNRRILIDAIVYDLIHNHKLL